MSNSYITYYSSPLGRLKIESSDTDIVAVRFDETDDTEVVNEHPLLKECTDQLDEYFAGTRTTFNLPMKQPGTTFQQAVWALLNKIPFGKFISYTELSKQYGDLKAIRAVASANGKNNIAIIVPCHRVIGSTQKLVGYSGGLWRKKWLVEHESKHALGVQAFDF